ncbi:hypothetical protein ACOSP7_018017 [Xanthoceras sorbifolium]
MVRDLLLPSGGWNSSLIQPSFLLADVKAILNIPLSSSRYVDSLFWHFDELGIYSVKSGYLVGMDQFLLASGSGLSPSESWWKFLWRINIPQKVKVFEKPVAIGFPPLLFLPQENCR